ncbi:MAG: hypothetical protein IK031_06330 [Bacteroidales bacterium]|nr:hypothetical protein [Bacteroidales bacterium]
MKKTLLLLSALFLAVALNAQNGPYGIKSGHLKYENQTSGGTQYNELWFDDYGLLRKQHDQIMMEGMGNYHTEILMRDNKIYSSAWFDDERTNEAGMTEGFPDLNFMNPSEQFKKDSQLKEAGTEEVFGKPCKIFTYKQKELLRTVSYKVWVWEGIILKMETKGILGANNSQMVTLLEENVKIPASTFAIPEKVKEIKKK